MPNTIIVTREEPIAIVQLNRPEVLNALNEEVLDELVQALTALDDLHNGRIPGGRAILVPDGTA